MGKGAGNRRSIIELFRFIAIMLIIVYHSGYLGMDSSRYPFSISWIYVEFFFILTGYFTVVHFERQPAGTIDEAAMKAMQYTVKKYRSVSTYIFISVSVYYVLLYVSSVKIFSLSDIGDYVFDVTLLSGIIKDRILFIPSLWFLASMFIVFPAFCMLVQLRKKNLLFIIALYFVLLYYGYTEEIAVGLFPEYLPRAFAGLSLGILVHFISQKLDRNGLGPYAGRYQEIVLTFVELMAAALLFIFQFNNIQSIRFIIFLFTVLLSITLSNRSYTSKIENRFFDYLSKLNVIVYIFHIPIATTVFLYLPKASTPIKILIYYCGSILLAMGVNCIGRRFRRKKH